MAFKMTMRNGVYLENINEYFCDSASDLTNIPLTGSDGATFGSIARCIDDGSVYILDSTGTWVEQGGTASDDDENDGGGGILE